MLRYLSGEVGELAKCQKEFHNSDLKIVDIVTEFTPNEDLIQSRYDGRKLLNLFGAKIWGPCLLKMT